MGERQIRKMKNTKKKEKYAIKRLNESSSQFKFQLVKKKADSRKVIFDQTNPFSFKIVKETNTVERNNTNTYVNETNPTVVEKDSTKKENPVGKEKCDDTLVEAAASKSVPKHPHKIHKTVKPKTLKDVSENL